jgi:predicted transcriptional regulator
MLSIQIGLTKLYNLIHLKDLESANLPKQIGKRLDNCSQAYFDIVSFRSSIVELDRAVLEAYAWSDVQLRHDFYEMDYLPETDRIRFTIHPDARKEILKRLLELNHKIREDEVKQGLWNKKRWPKKRTQYVVEEPKPQYGLDL